MVHDRRLAETTGFRAGFALLEGFRRTILWYRRRGWL
jgi:hypothetical protein